ncbi:CDGSH iron-sulfur domain-containing protein [Streptomyces sp. NPDC093225]|uniref:CDGSH iron-sulfur domain-containing protein n=1 Tax=Streptomyces sp. NPDC093225 TaxID=3366034 RepID=UPI00380B53B3
MCAEAERRPDLPQDGPRDGADGRSGAEDGSRGDTRRGSPGDHRRGSGGEVPEPPSRSAPVPRATAVLGGPVLIEGPVEVVLPDGTVRRSDRPVVALCACRRSLRYPFCDTSHRGRVRR